MTDREKDLLNQISKQTEDIEVPESLKPEAVEKMLKNRPVRFRWKKSYTGWVAAACLMLVCGLAWNNSQRAGLLERPGKSSETAATESASPELVPEEEQAVPEFSLKEGEGLKTASSYDEIYEYIVEQYGEYDPDAQYGYYEGEELLDGDVVYESAAMADEDVINEVPRASESKTAAAPGGMAEEAAGDMDYSQTNVRQEGVDEADIAKTDGRYIYTLLRGNTEIGIVDTKDGKLNKACTVKPEELESIHEFFVSDGKLIVVGEVRHEEPEEDGPDDKVITYGYWERSDTMAITYDVSNPEKPKQLGKVSQSGYYSSARLVDGYLYLLSQYYVGFTRPRDEVETYIPKAGGELIDESAIFLPCTKSAYMYEVIGAVDIDHPDELTDSKAIFADGGELYVSNTNIYWYATVWGGETETTVVRRIAYKDGRLRAEAVGEVAGYVESSFSIDEYKDHVRMITTSYTKDYDEINNIYVLDMDLKVVGEITGLAEDERVYSARMMGDVGYFVTFRETDPLFSVDFSDPKNPKIIGELKIPGFSEYLHPYGEGKLLGIGMDMDEEGISTSGVKISMFDVSDKSDVKEVDKLVLENVYDAGALYDYKAVLINPDRNIIAFSAEGGSGESYYVFTYKEKDGFKQLMEEGVSGSGYLAARGIYIGKTLYVVKGNIIQSYEMEKYSKLDDIIL